MKSLQKEQIAQITYYEPQSAGINLQSTQSDSTPRSLPLHQVLSFQSFSNTYIQFKNEHFFVFFNYFKFYSRITKIICMVTEFILATY